MTPPLVIAHRGASHAHPPGNTIEAFRAARRLGADWVELDVRRTADGVATVHHDAELPDGRLIVELAAQELPAYVPSLAEALDACEGMGVNVEIKNAPVDPDWDETQAVVGTVVQLLRARTDGPYLVTSFHPSAIGRVRELAPELSTGLLAFDLEDPAAVVEQAVSGGHQALNPWDPFVTAELVGLAHEAGLALNVWTVDDRDRMAELVTLGVDGIITDVPDVLRALLQS